MYLLRLMLVGVWLGYLWLLFYFFDHYIQSSASSTSWVPSVQSFGTSVQYIAHRPLAVIRNRRLNSVALLAPLRSVQFIGCATQH